MLGFVTEGGWINQLKEHKRTFTNILKLSSHHAVNTENKGGKDELCFGGNRGVGGLNSATEDPSLAAEPPLA